MSFRIGYGYDSHRFIAGDFIYIGGIKIPFNKGIKAHSDGDVLLHAIADALLGAAALGDLGQHFSDSDSQYKGVASEEFLKKILILLTKKNFSIVNIDATVVTEAPKLSEHKLEMQMNIARLLNIDENCVNVKAKTNEKMGWIGRGEGLAATAVVLIQKV